MNNRTRNLRAGLRDTYLILNEFRQPLLFFVIAILGIGTYYFYTAQSLGEPLNSLPEAYYMILGLAFFQSIGEFPQHNVLQIWFFILPIIAIGTFAQGLADFGIALFNRRTRNKEWAMAVASTFSKHTILVGLGHLGYRVVTQMSAMGESVVVIEIDPKTDLVSTVQKMGIPIIQEDAHLQSTLEFAGIHLAKTIVLCTQNDSLNLQIALKARSLNPTIKVVMRIFDDDFAKSLDTQFGFKAISTTSMAAPAFAFAATGTDITHPITVEGESLSWPSFVLINLLLLMGKVWQRVERNFDVSIVLLKREFEPDLHPIGDRFLENNDTLAILGNPIALQKSSMKIIDHLPPSPSRSPTPEINNLLIGIVGPCSSGKTTLVNSLIRHGYNARHIAQEHSYVPDMWQRITQPDILIFLNVSYDVSQQRRPLNWNISDFEEQQKRLAHARLHANFTINTDDFSIDEILTVVLDYLHHGIN